MGDNEEELGIRFPPMNNVYDQELRVLAQKQSQALGISLHASGVYAWMVGPAYELPEEIEMVRRLGADLVGMSTVPEVIAARHMATKRPGVRILAISCITNMAAGLVPKAPSHEEVTETGARMKVDFARLMTGIISNLPT
jgi:purine-nucleoside phosphorylase